ncbi:uncharacterized protein N7477_001259 [Penicillium maclennaniae]|uniref:uncharacterized protein n=1 Tax=Penicillium maclennaniae TaxID=1343394 RepID=UPI002542315E|nr:uncharacterized protein N7477_001259 [Penicillium maclennaniae]KAJ5681319.1 hypothetical protein N7477_001259 [Penicillium maclennaniae]
MYSFSVPDMNPWQGFRLHWTSLIIIIREIGASHAAWPAPFGRGPTRVGENARAEGYGPIGTDRATKRAIPPVSILQQDQNRNVAEQADIVLLGCKHSSLGELVHDLQGVLHDPRRILVSLMGGVSPGLIVEALHFWTGPVVRAVCSVAMEVGESITLLSTTDNGTDDAESRRAVTDLFASVGVVQWLPECQMNVASALSASSLAFFAQMIEGLAQGVAEQHSNSDNTAQQLPLDVALAITAQAARGTAALLQQSKSPSDLVAQVATKGGATAAGLAVLEKEKVVQTLQTCAAITAKATAALAPSVGANGEDKTTGMKISRADSSS